MSLETKLSGLSNQLEDVVDLIVKFKGLSTRPNPDFSQKDLAGAIQFKFQAIESEFAYLKYEIDDVLKTSEKQHYETKYNNLQEEFKSARALFRRSQIDNRKTTADLRRELLGGNINDQINRRNRTDNQKSQLVNKAEDVTAVMRQLHKMAQTEAMVSSINLEELEQSTNNLQQLHMRYSGFDLLLTGSKQLIRHLEQADKWDRIYMLASLGFLFLVLAWIVWRRILKAPVYLLFSTVRFVVRIGGGGGSSKANKVLSTAVTELVPSSVAQSEISSVMASVSAVVESSVSLIESSADSASLAVDSIFSSVSSSSGASTETPTVIPVNEDL